jgi:tetratricopeptide (TPR) repeat protein
LKLDHFAALGVKRGASREQVQGAFVEAAKTWHPDRAPAGDEALKLLFGKVFARLEVARATLSDPAARLAYTEELARAMRPATAVDTNHAEASLEFKKAEVLLKKNDAKQAEAHLVRAVGLAPAVVEYGALLVWVRVKPGATPSEIQASIRELDDLIHQDAKCARAYFYRGQLKKRAGQDAGAKSDFERTVELDPANIDAAREVRLYKMRNSGGMKAAAESRADGDGGAAGFFRRIFSRRAK